MVWPVRRKLGHRDYLTYEQCPRQRARLGDKLLCDQAPPNGFTINSGARYVSDRFANNNNSVIADGYVTLDTGLSYTQNRWSITLRGRNLLNAEYEPVAGTTMRRLADPHSVECSTRYLF